MGECYGHGKCEYMPKVDEYRCTCEGNYDPKTSCKSCMNNYAPDTNCTQCKTGYDINTLCARCELGRNESTGCAECLQNYLLKDGSCAQCEHNMDINRRCTQCPDNTFPDIYGDCSSLTKSPSTVGIAISVVLGVVALIAIIIVSVVLVRRKRSKNFADVEVTPLL